jgi:predicted enzyme related to lactoylglutathione lyase
MDTSQKSIGFLGVKGVALPVVEEGRAEHFYGKVLGLPVATQSGEPLGYLLGETVLMLKSDWYASPSAEPCPRITLQVNDARGTEQTLQERGVVIADKVESYGGSYVGSFLDSEGNKLWFCSYK